VLTAVRGFVAILRYLYDLDVGWTNNHAERDLRPTRFHRKISGCFRSKAGADRFGHLRSYLSTTRKNDIPAIDALTRLLNGDPRMPPRAGYVNTYHSSAPRGLRGSTIAGMRNLRTHIAETLAA